ncbi:1-(5-phosphoribosyl)-5-[(5-phosphoribosylamino)methylideneamino]imidazole-4-carboxamide isomerase [Lysobacter auxotrophicus]|uniref:1-(5-phosphoribosyl)-5-[(5-phosphoribosylamino)methylideneamino] imidazole-4-carboxamide isomerase n=1 Tax=Lysobacter auxotrophicus TaxID=2992573 RepID=A0ABN6ULI3_9GAMM|nr:1-(5-phosphoribosyl)-5-[(5-phosphoribosylamino)methylideneamino]imidazole-4-carboxamide isomerase [Lysobacter auxotrophicus]BDU17136.1 1-(5-phosphoribosyl)-5-[(5-phosphoribosylamino)methylideneamino]imidazole-4-carboxamide isomerase [Lysobacter auxotrophicus]
MNAFASTTPRRAFELYPAIDVRDGRVVRLHQGDYERETRYAPSPIELASQYAESGAGWLHLVDLDAAREGGYTLRALVREVVTHTGLNVQTGGGVRSEDDVALILDAGARRVVVGSLAVRETERVLGWIARFGADRITVALDARQDASGAWRLPTAGWTQDSGVELETLVRRFADGGLRHLLCTDIARDGMLAGPNLALYRHLSNLAPELSVQASGGVRDVDDIEGARDAGCAGAVLGKALIEGRFALEDAMRRTQRC